MTYEEEVMKGAEAEQILENPVFREVMDTIEKDLDNLTLAIKTTDKELCVDVIQRRQVFESIKMQIVRFIETGKVAQASLQAEAEVKARKKEYKR